ncbi:hypothetical protein N7532_007615 [Penicillium argentinense]|uniref:2EXR domain-containing protein n=1 Tax=Penicillium argentinense TaxID=1131581 RepID=A0A9W9EW24_9EURO|nr:uncharacterized protein N7532_007615 [Penicillium argentinense]KAJ5088931.1 hypothetical protein N7532_007615 [Penicillium argentinense]
MAEKSFHLFPRLPTELRLQIWRLCLPCRVWDTDWPTDDGTFFDELKADRSYPCRVTPTAILNGLPPVIARVCQESRNVAKESGGILKSDTYKDLPDDAVFVSTTTFRIDENFWVDTKRDSAHLNWTPYYESIYQNCFGSALASLAWESRLVVGRPSIMCDWFEMTVNKKEERFDVFEQIPSWWVIMHVVFIHASFREAAHTGFFGLLGDASVQIVSLSDEEKANALYDFADECDRKASSGEGIQRVSLQSLMQELKDRFMRHRISENISSRMHPAIMFRLCTSKCNSLNEDLSSQ